MARWLSVLCMVVALGLWACQDERTPAYPPPETETEFALTGTPTGGAVATPTGGTPQEGVVTVAKNTTLPLR